MAFSQLPADPVELLQHMRSLPKDDTQEILTQYTRALSHLKDDRPSLEIFLDYMELAVPCMDQEDIEHIYSLMKVKLRAFYEYWESYMHFEVKIRKKEKSLVLDRILNYLRVKVFPGRDELIQSLEQIEKKPAACNDNSVFLDNQQPAENTAVNEPNQNENAFELEALSTLMTISCEAKRRQENEQNECSGPLKSSLAEEAVNYTSEPISKNKNNNRTELSNIESKSISEKSILFECPVMDDTVVFSKAHIQVLQIKDRELIKFKKLGKGGYSVVYKVLMDGEVYALKQIHVVDRDGLKACNDEIFLLDKLKNHEFVINMIDYEIKESMVNILLEYGETDLQRMITDSPMSIFLIKYVWESILKILRFIHSKRIVHRDIKPANFVMVCGKVKLIDFGISKSIRADTTSIINTEKAGTLNYISPEQCTGKRVSRAADIWAAGCILYNMVYRKNVHPCKTAMDVIRFMSEEKEIEFRTADELAIDCMKRCLVYDPKQRAKPDELLSHPFLSKG